MLHFPKKKNYNDFININKKKQKSVLLQITQNLNQTLYFNATIHLYKKRLKIQEIFALHLT